MGDFFMKRFRREVLLAALRCVPWSPKYLGWQWVKRGTIFEIRIRLEKGEIHFIFQFHIRMQRFFWILFDCFLSDAMQVSSFWTCESTRPQQNNQFLRFGVPSRHAFIFPDWHQHRMALISWCGKDWKRSPGFPIRSMPYRFGCIPCQLCALSKPKGVFQKWNMIIYIYIYKSFCRVLILDRYAGSASTPFWPQPSGSIPAKPDKDRDRKRAVGHNE